MEPLRQGDPRQAGAYRLEGRLGGGGMGQVFLGRSRGGRPVAVKLVRPELADDAGFRRRFAQEVEAARRVGGFYTAQVVDADPDADPPWLVTAYIPGPSLHQAVATHGPLPAEAITVLGAGLAEGLGAIHACDLVHRDLKPSNVILAADGPRVIDFGITRALDATSHTLSHVVVGTPSFMSPEQARGHEIGQPSDVFSLGLVLAFAATGRSPFGTGPAQAIVYRIVHDGPDLTGMPAHLADLVRRCLAKDPGDRARVADLLEELTNPTQTITQWPPPPIATMITERLVQTSTALASEVEARVRELIGRGKNVEAIKLVRQRTDLGLKDAKELVDAIAAGYAVPAAGPGMPGLPGSPGGPGQVVDAETRAGAEELIAKGKLIKAITLVRQRTGLGLKEAKDYCEALRDGRPWREELHAALVGLGYSGKDADAAVDAVAADLTGDEVPLIHTLLKSAIRKLSRKERPPRPPGAGHPVAISHGVGTTTAAVTLALLCLPGLLYLVSKTVEYLQDPDAPTELIAVNMAVGIVEAVLLATGALLLFQHKMAGRWMIAATGGAAALHGMSVSVQYLLVGGPPSVAAIAFVVGPLTAVSAAAAMIMAIHPSTGRWCLRRS
ncbi:MULTISPECIES: protein kinase domain-containing protein [unclassified Streptosporangium]|uniref:protein kinase domain-containing protein n=1 Tax=unclassified Streptosporangium TaxID=2632669 RepID=UPI002E27E3D1|nr:MULTISPECIES: protein kinase [unclassified Streptosporangium]